MLLLVVSLLLVVRPGAPSSVLAPCSDALVPSSVLLFLVASSVPSSYASKDTTRTHCHVPLHVILSVSRLSSTSRTQSVWSQSPLAPK